MALTTAQLQTLKTELTTDPRTYGYAAPVAAPNWNAVAALLNLVRDGTNGGPAISIKRNDIKALEVLQCVDLADFKPSPTILEGSWFESVTQDPQGKLQLFNEDDTASVALLNIRALLTGGATTSSRTRVNTMAKRNGSRSEELGLGKGYLVTDSDVEAAVRLP
jgi:hypothetical protein